MLQLLSAATEDFARGDTALRNTSVHHGNHDRPSEEGRGSTRHRNRHNFQEVGRQNFGTSIQQGCTVDMGRRRFRAATDMDPELTVLSIDGVGAYDHVHRSAILKALGSPGFASIAPFRAVRVRTTFNLSLDRRPR